MLPETFPHGKTEIFGLKCVMVCEQGDQRLTEWEQKDTEYMNAAVFRMSVFIQQTANFAIYIQDVFDNISI